MKLHTATQAVTPIPPFGDAETFALRLKKIYTKELFKTKFT